VASLIMDIQRSGMCNSRAIQILVGLEPWRIVQNYPTRHNLGVGMNRIMYMGGPIGAIRTMSTTHDLVMFVLSPEEFVLIESASILAPRESVGNPEAVVWSLTTSTF